MRIFLPVLVIAAIVILANALFTVQETEFAIKFRLGEVVRADYEPGLHYQMPFINNVRKFDNRLRTMDMPPERMNTAEQKYVDVDYYVKWRIFDPRAYYIATRGDEAFTRARLSELIRNDLRDEFAQRTLSEAVSEQRRNMMEALVVRADQRFRSFGIDVIDVRIKRIELTDEVLGSVFDRMETQRTEYANELRSLGREEAERIRADADRRVRVLLAEADRDAERLRGEGDARATAIYAEAFERDAEFYAFWRSLSAYDESMGTENDVLLLDAQSDFFRYFNRQHRD